MFTFSTRGPPCERRTQTGFGPTRFDTNPASTINSAAGNVTRQKAFGHHLELSPKVWLGYVSQ